MICGESYVISKIKKNETYSKWQEKRNVACRGARFENLDIKNGKIDSGSFLKWKWKL